jgi:hypothetical protein
VEVEEGEEEGEEKRRWPTLGRGGGGLKKAEGRSGRDRR